MTIAMATQVIVTAAILLASYAGAGTGPHGFGTAQILALLASGVVAALLAHLCTRAIETSQANAGRAIGRSGAGRRGWRTDGAGHHQGRARCLPPDRRNRAGRGVERPGRGPDRMDATRGRWRRRRRPRRRRAAARRFQATHDAAGAGAIGRADRHALRSDVDPQERRSDPDRSFQHRAAAGRRVTSSAPS